MITTEYEQDAPPVAGRDVLCPLGARVAVRGHLHLCLANVGEYSLEAFIALQSVVGNKKLS